MSLTRNKLYLIFSIALVSGYAWLFYELARGGSGTGNTPGLCIFKHVTDLPCPSCGSTRSVVSILHGNFREALSINPLGIPVALIMLLAPLWMLYDLITRKNSLFSIYCRMETFLKKPAIAVPLICLVIINWIWNIFKGL